MTLLERDGQLKQLDRLLARCRKGNGGVVVVQGPVGTGKSELLQAFATRVQRAGVVLVSATATAAERNLPFGVVGQFARASPAGLDQCVRAALAEPKPGNPSATRAAASLLLAAARQRPMVITVDDVQHADAASLQCLLHVVGRRPAPVLVVLCESNLSASPRTPLHEKLLDPAQGHRLRLGPLGHAGVAAMLAAYLGPAAAERLAARTATVTGGNPLLVRALIEDNRGAPGQPPVELIAGEALGITAVSALHRCGPATVQLARAIAVLHEDATPDRLGRLLDVPEPAVRLGVEGLTAAGLLDPDRGRFSEPAIRDAVVQDLAADERAGLHAGAAALLHGDGAPHEVVARHLMCAGRPPAPWAAELLSAHAAAALDEGRADSAVTSLELVLRAVDDDRSRLQLFRARWHANPSLAAMHLAGSLAGTAGERPSDEHRATALLCRLWLGDLDGAAGELARLHADPSVPPSHAQALRTLLMCAFPTVGRGVDGPAPEHLVEVLTCGTDANAAAPVAATLRFANPAAEPLYELCSLLYADRPDRAMLAAGPRPRTPFGLGLDAAIGARIALARGDLDLAARRVNGALHHVPPRGWGVVVGLPLACAITAATAAGRHDEAHRHLRQPVPPAMFETPFGLTYLRARGIYCLATGQIHAALDDFHTCRELMDSWALDLPTLVPWRTDAARGYLHLGERRLARQLTRDQLRRAGPHLPRARGLTLWVMSATVDDLDERAELLQEAVRLHIVAGDRLELAVALRSLGQTQRACGAVPDARESLTHAWRLAVRCGAEPLRAGVVADLADLAEDGTPAPGAAASLPAGSLSSSEQRVAALALRGRTNREIASELHVTVSTIEQHLTRIYRKLHISGRANLPAWLGSTPGRRGPVGVKRHRDTH